MTIEKHEDSTHVYNWVGEMYGCGGHWYVSKPLSVAAHDIVSDDADTKVRLGFESNQAYTWCSDMAQLEIEYNIAILNDKRKQYRDVL